MIRRKGKDMRAWGRLSKMTPTEIRELQNRKLRSFLTEYIFPFSPYYRSLFDKHGIKPEDIRTIRDLGRIPLTSKKDLIGEGEDSARFKDFIQQPNKEKIRSEWKKSKLITRAASARIQGRSLQEDLTTEFKPCFMTFTTGTTRKPVSFFYTRYDLENLNVSGARMLELFGFGQDDTIVNMFPYAPHLAFWQVVLGGFETSTLILSTGGGRTLGTEGNIKAILKMKPSILIGVPSYVYHVLRVARANGEKMPFVRKVVLGAARVTVGFKRKLISLLEEMGAQGDISVFGTYGFTEARCAWGECPTPPDESSGYFCYPDKEIFEVIDPETGEAKGEGEDGELVYTSLDSRGSSVLRYRTGDYVRGGIRYDRCERTGTYLPRISSDITRLSDVKDLSLTKIKGSLVNLNHFMEILNDAPRVKEWQLEIAKKDNDPFELDVINVYLCLEESEDRDQVCRELNSHFQSTTELTPNGYHFITMDEMVQRLQLETANKDKRIVDRREEC